MAESRVDQSSNTGRGAGAPHSHSIVASFRAAFSEVDPVVAQIILWRYGWRSASDEAIAERVGWPVERVVAASDEALRAVWARVAIAESA